MFCILTTSMRSRLDMWDRACAILAMIRNAFSSCFRRFGSRLRWSATKAGVGTSIALFVC